MIILEPRIFLTDFISILHSKNYFARLTKKAFVSNDRRPLLAPAMISSLHGPAPLGSGHLENIMFNIFILQKRTLSFFRFDSSDMGVLRVCISLLVFYKFSHIFFPKIEMFCSYLY